jgi:hypothetical protein
MGNLISRCCDHRLPSLLLLGALAACSKDKAPVEPPEPGEIEGSIAVDHPLISLDGWTARLYDSQDDPEDRDEVESATVRGSNGTYHFTMRDVMPGRYYADVCSPDGEECIVYSTSDPLNGPPTALEVEEEETTRLSWSVRVGTVTFHLRSLAGESVPVTFDLGYGDELTVHAAALVFSYDEYEVSLRYSINGGAPETEVWDGGIFTVTGNGVRFDSHEGPDAFSGVLSGRTLTVTTPDGLVWVFEWQRA